MTVIVFAFSPDFHLSQGWREETAFGKTVCDLPWEFLKKTKLLIPHMDMSHHHEICILCGTVMQISSASTCKCICMQTWHKKFHTGNSAKCNVLWWNLQKANVILIVNYLLQGFITAKSALFHFKFITSFNCTALLTVRKVHYWHGSYPSHLLQPLMSYPPPICTGILYISEDVIMTDSIRNFHTRLSTRAVSSLISSWGFLTITFRHRASSV